MGLVADVFRVAYARRDRHNERNRQRMPSQAHTQHTQTVQQRPEQTTNSHGLLCTLDPTVPIV